MKKVTMEVVDEQVEHIVVSELENIIKYCNTTSHTHPEDVAYYYKLEQACEVVLEHFKV